MTVLVCGEALYDLFQADEPGGDRLSFDARVGGSPFNVAVGLARLGAPCAMLAALSTDLFGERLARRLAREGVDDRFLLRSDRPTTLSIVGLDAAGGASYAFYGRGGADTSLTVADVPALGAEVAALHFGSYSLVVAPGADAFAALAARHAQKFVSLDPNIRPSIEPDRAVWRRRLDALRSHANLVKASAEDLAWLSPGTPPRDTARSWAQEGADLVVLTDGDGEIYAWRGDRQLQARAEPVETVDTVGAGDAFQAALLAELERLGGLAPGLGGLSDAQVAGVLTFAARAAAFVCGRRGSDPPRRSDL